MRIPVTFIALIFITITGYAQNELKDPSFEDILSLKNPGKPYFSPDGRHIIFTVRSTDWEENRYDTELWISKDGGKPFQLTNNPDGNSSNPQWSPDSKWIAFKSDRGNKTQLYAIRLEGGESIAITEGKRSIQQFHWSPDGEKIAFKMPMDVEKIKKAREKRYGKYGVDDDEFTLSELWLMSFKPPEFTKTKLPEHAQDSVAEAARKPVKIIEEPEYYINEFLWSPDGTTIAIGHQPDPLIMSFFNADISLLNVETKEVTPLISNKSDDKFIDWSPDGKSLIYSSSVDNRTSNFYKNGQYFIHTLGKKKSSEIGTEFDENLSGITWTPSGIYATAYQKTKRKLVAINPADGKVKIILENPARIYGFTLDKRGGKIAFSGNNDNELNEIYVSRVGDLKPTRLTNFSTQISGFNVSKSEVISWKSADGSVIEGILHKPSNYEKGIKYPLLVMIHGGPTGISTPGPAPSYVYPVVQWLNKGALVLQPNYRGSAGYGEKFRELNVENLGVGDAWDVLSGVDYLDQQGLIDTDKLGCMGWSQGGYISAFLTTNTDRFKAISVGAGISDWMTYYVNTDIHPFTRQYLKATPWENPEIYAKTSPMTNINNASTPTLIQHGEFDKRVPIPNAYQLLQGLRDKGIPTKLVVYKGFGHGITKPRERLAATWHNWQWFGKYIWGEDIELPEAKDQ